MNNKKYIYKVYYGCLIFHFNNLFVLDEYSNMIKKKYMKIILDWGHIIKINENLFVKIITNTASVNRIDY